METHPLYPPLGDHYCEGMGFSTSRIGIAWRGRAESKPGVRLILAVTAVTRLPSSLAISSGVLQWT